MNKLENLPVSASMEVSLLAKQLSLEGREIINMSIGDPHFPISNLIKEKLMEACEMGYTHYDKAAGLDILREKIAQKYQVKSSEILIGAGVKNLLYHFILTQSGKIICVLEPAWLGYKGICHLTNLNYKPIDIYQTNWLELLKKENFDLLLVCSPNNPDGKIFSEKEVNEIINIVESKNAILILDEIYNDFQYENENHFKKYYNLPNIIIFNGFSKSQAAAGLRVGYGIFKNEKLINLIIKIQQNTSTCVNTISQYALSFFNENQPYVNSYFEYYKSNRNIILKELPILKKFFPEGGFYYFFRPKDFDICINGKEFCKKILKENGLAMIPGDAYGKGFDDFVRMSFCLERTKLELGIQKLKSFLIKYA